MLNNWTILGLQFGVSALAAALIFFEYVQPRLAKLPFHRAVLPMLLLQAYRFTGITLLVGGQADAAIPQDALAQMAWGDYLSGVTALLAAYAVWRRLGLSVPLIWLFVVVCVADLTNVTRIIFEINFFSYDIGSTWTFLMWYLPWVVISLVYLLYRLFNRAPQA
ncbi:MAG: hypothetical protein R2867_32470 [Caldilineaceae bacterium]